MGTVQAAFDESASLNRVVGERNGLEIERLATRLFDCFRSGGKLLIAGNGGSAALAQHMAAEFVVRAAAERGPLPAIALTADGAVLTAGANDYGFDDVFARQIRAIGRPGDILLLISASGRSESILRAAVVGRACGLHTAALVGLPHSQLTELVDCAIDAPSKSVARIQEAHLTVGHVLCELVDTRWLAQEKHG